MNNNNCNVIAERLFQQGIISEQDFKSPEFCNQLNQIIELSKQTVSPLPRDQLNATKNEFDTQLNALLQQYTYNYNGLSAKQRRLRFKKMHALITFGAQAPGDSQLKKHVQSPVFFTRTKKGKLRQRYSYPSLIPKSPRKPKEGYTEKHYIKIASTMAYLIEQEQNQNKLNQMKVSQNQLRQFIIKYPFTAHLSTVQRSLTLK